MRPHCGKRGFTIVELLIVLFIILALVSMIVPAIQTLRMHAVQTQCLSSMRNIGMAFQRYANDFGAWIPREGDPHEWNVDVFKPWPIVLNYEWSWLTPVQLNHEMRKRTREVLCPAAPFPDLLITGYQVNGMAFSARFPIPMMGIAETQGPCRITQIRRPSEVIMMLDYREFDWDHDFHVAVGLLPPQIDRATGMFWPGHWDFWSVEWLPAPLGRIPLDTKFCHQRNTINVMFFDGRAEARHVSSLNLRMFDDGIRAHPNRRPIPRVLPNQNAGVATSTQWRGRISPEPDGRLRRMTADDALLKGSTPISPRLRAIARERAGGDARQIRLDAVEVNGKPAIVFSREDISSALVGHSIDGVVGYDGGSATEIMTRLLLNSAGK